ncbi:O-antigen ligase family protein [Oricola cellulosilytica]|uniref:O-antigen ligase family protein n=1 Tax=Oricola cellulosilytica TaxID=1429082 RepID=A0A4R0PB93_9HYPH|nr:O-antigen ligase family protein [Oricola cellulosilytica]TCD13490.1 O-antigen ligase family protein [Oricola cellulosilytica]
MDNVMREQGRGDQAYALTLPLVFDPRRIMSALAPMNGFDRNNRIWLFLVGAAAPAFGSTLSVVLWCAFVWAVISLALRRFPFRIDRWVATAATAAGLYASVKIGFALAHNGLERFSVLSTTFVFFAPLVVGIRLRLTPYREVLDLFVLACGFSVVIAAPVAAYQVMTIGLRADAWCGNPGIFAVMSLLFGSIGTLNTLSPWPARRWLGALAYLAMLFCVIASGMRAVWIAIPLVTAVLVWASSRTLSRSVLRRGLLAASAIVVAGLTFAAQPIMDRVGMFGQDIELMQSSDDYDSSTGRRILMLAGGWRAVKEAPWTGYGLTARMDAVAAYLDPEDNSLVGFTHPHNGYLAALLDAGIFGLVALLVLLGAPVALALASPNDKGRTARIAIGAILTLTYAITGAPGIMFEHDLMDSAFVATLIVLACSMAPPGVESGQGAGTVGQIA